jgi:hypothetical protein
MLFYVMIERGGGYKLIFHPNLTKITSKRHHFVMGDCNKLAPTNASKKHKLQKFLSDCLLIPLHSLNPHRIQNSQ